MRPAQREVSCWVVIGLVRAMSRNFVIGHSGDGDIRLAERMNALSSFRGRLAAFSKNALKPPTFSNPL